MNHSNQDHLSGRWALAGLSLSMLLSSLGTSIANVALPTLAGAFSGTFQEVQWVVLAYLLAITASIVGAGRLGDRIGRRRLLRAGLLLFTGASVVTGVAPALWLVIVARAAQGLGAAVMMALAIAFVTEIVPKAKTGSAMGLLGTISAIGTALGPSLGGVLIGVFGWRALFLINLPLGVVAVVLAHRYLPADRPSPTRERAGFDGLGTSLLVLTLAAYSLAMTLGRGQFGTLNLALLIATAVGVALFLLVERRASSPLLRLSMFRDPALGASLLANVLVSTVLMATLVVGPFYLALALRLDAGVVGIVMSIGPVVAALTGVPAGRLVDRFGTHRMTLIGLGGIAVGALLLSVTPEALGVPGYVAPIVVITANYALFQAANNTAVMRDVGPEQRGVVSGTLSLSRNLGLITGASVMGAVFALASSSNDITAAAPEAVATGMRVTFAVATALVMVAIAVVAGAAELMRTRAPARLVIWALALILFPNVSAAQQPGHDARLPPLSGHDRGFAMRSPDGVNSLRILGLFQPQFAHKWVPGSPGENSLFVNRARVGLLGSVLSRDLEYMFVAEFGGGDPRLLFFNVDYTLIRDWLTVRVGQFKRPFSRPFIAFASQLSMIERPLTVGPSVFGDDADIGVMLHNGSSGRFEYAVGVFNGTGPNVVPDQVHPLVAARVGYNTGGMTPYSESDLEGGPPRFGVAVAGLVDLDADRDHESFVSGLADLMFKAHGFSLSSALHVGSRQSGPRWSDQRLSAIGHYTQLGHVIADRVEPVVRYSLVLSNGRGNDQHDLAGGLNLFFHGHRFKWQNFVSVRFQPHDGFDVQGLSFRSQLSLAF
ncbi:MAG TPA: MFS transporter [Enhygromyxa sp.]|nr:MFS transporter [Enhygromyxa sp.]